MVRGNFLSTFTICNMETDIGNNPDPAGKKEFFCLSVCGCVEGWGRKNIRNRVSKTITSRNILLLFKF